MQATLRLWFALLLMLCAFPLLYAAPFIGLFLLSVAPWLGLFAFPLMLSPAIACLFTALVIMRRAEQYL